MKTTKFTAGLIAFSLAVSAAAAPARANSEDVVKVVGGLLTLLVIGKAIDSANDKSPKPAPVYNYGHGKGKGHAASPFDIPQVCVVTLDRNGKRDSSVALKSCLEEKRVAKAPLPQRCEMDVRSNRRTLDAYDVSCLGRYGYEVADRRR